MSLTITNVDETIMGNKKVVRADIQFDASYPAAGEPLAPGDLGMGSFDLVLVAPSGGLMFEFIHSTDKVKAWFPTGGAATTTLADPTVAVASGGTAVTSTAAQPDLTETSGRGKEPGATTDLSTITCRIWCVGGV
jgi:hypothetical protein